MQRIREGFVGTGEVKGILFTQIFRYNDLCLYFRSDGYFEIVRARRRKAFMRRQPGKSIEYIDKEHYPRGDKWRPFERCTSDQTRAVQYYNFAAQYLGYEIIYSESDLVKILSAVNH